MVAGLACLTELKKAGNEQKLAQQTEKLAKGLQRLADKHQVPFVVNYVAVCSVFLLIKKAELGYQDVMAHDTEKFKRFFHKMLALGVYLAPSAFEASFMSLAHSDEDIDRTLAAADIAFAELA